MGNILAPSASGAPHGAVLRRGPLARLSLLLAFCLAGCHSIQPLDTKPLDTAGMTYDSIQQLKALNITAPEVAQLVTARQSGFSDTNCIATVSIYRGRSQAFDAGDEIAGLVRARVGEDTILELAKLNQLGLGAGELRGPFGSHSPGGRAPSRGR
jgi:hypothetical protein